MLAQSTGMGPSQRWRSSKTRTGELSILDHVNQPMGPRKVCVNGHTKFVCFLWHYRTRERGIALLVTRLSSALLFRFEGEQLMRPLCAASLLGCFSSCHQPPLKENRSWVLGVFNVSFAAKQKYNYRALRNTTVSHFPHFTFSSCAYTDA